MPWGEGVWLLQMWRERDGLGGVIGGYGLCGRVRVVVWRDVERANSLRLPGRIASFRRITQRLEPREHHRYRPHDFFQKFLHSSSRLIYCRLLVARGVG